MTENEWVRVINSNPDIVTHLGEKELLNLWKHRLRLISKKALLKLGVSTSSEVYAKMKQYDKRSNKTG
jgi:hypothetical protein